MSLCSPVTFCAHCHKKFHYRTTERLCEECENKWWKINGDAVLKLFSDRQKGPTNNYFIPRKRK